MSGGTALMLIILLLNQVIGMFIGICIGHGVLTGQVRESREKTEAREALAFMLLGVLGLAPGLVVRAARGLRELVRIAYPDPKLPEAQAREVDE